MPDCSDYDPRDHPGTCHRPSGPPDPEIRGGGTPEGPDCQGGTGGGYPWGTPGGGYPAVPGRVPYIPRVHPAGTRPLPHVATVAGVLWHALHPQATLAERASSDICHLRSASGGPRAVKVAKASPPPSRVWHRPDQRSEAGLGRPA